MKVHRYDLHLGTMSPIERFTHPSGYENYLNVVYLMLNLCERYTPIPNNEIFTFAQVSSIEELEKKHPNRFVHTLNDQKEIENWFDLDADLIVMPRDPQYNILFVYKIRQLNILDIDDFLAYQSYTYYDDNTELFTRFVTLLMRQYRDKLAPYYGETILEWVAARKEPAMPSKMKGKIKREPDDKLTLLNQEMTVLLIYAMQKGKLLLKDEYLNNKEAGEAFHLLTGYSADTLRQKLRKAEIEKLVTKKNVVDLENHFIRLITLLQNEIRDRK